LLDECFIATAAYGSKLNPGVAILRQFRDTKLLTNMPGQAFVRFYYNISPKIAEHIAESSLLKGAVKILLLPVIAMAYILLNLPFIPAAVTIMVIVIVVIYFRRRRRLIA